jgi:bacterioferritin (cytochrome b1)
MTRYNDPDASRFNEPGNDPVIPSVNITGPGVGGAAMNAGMGMPAAGNDYTETIRQLNSLLRGEISAAETYAMAIKKLADSDKTSMDAVGQLRQMQEDHGRAAQGLRDRLRELGGEASDSSGAWGVWAQTVQGTANLFGDTSALKALKEGEEHGLKDYDEAMDDLDTTSQQLIESQFLPAQRRHIAVLDSMISQVGKTR